VNLDRLTLRGLVEPQRWRRRLRDALELFALPLACTVLPWAFTLRLLRWLSRFEFWHRQEVQISTAKAAQFGMAPDPAAFARRLRWRLLIEHMDCYLVPMRSRRYLRRWLRVTGDPLPGRGPVLFVGTHYGCGFWFLPYVRVQGLPVSMIVPPAAGLVSHLPILTNLYIRMRYQLVALSAGRRLTYRGNAAEAMGRQLEQGMAGLSLADMPTNRVDAVDVNLAGLPTRLAQSTFELAQRHAAPIYLFAADTDLATGQRTLHFQRLPDISVEAQVERFAQMLDTQIRSDPSGWRFWSIADSFFARSTAAATTRES
jgi:hypothetical protein